MQLRIRHISTYRFASPARFVVQSHRLMPATFQGQNVLDWNVSAKSGIFGTYFRDAAGDQIRTLSVSGPVSDLAILVQGTVETTDMSGVLQGLRETISPLSYMRPTPTTRPDAGLRDLADAALAGQTGVSELDRAHLLSAAVSRAIAYRPGVTAMHTTAAEALEQRQGVCQDHAHALIALANHTQIPARYVCGYLFARSDGSDESASHAWAELYVGSLGWVGFDPANQCCPDERYIRLGSGADAYEAAPIRGLSHGGATESLDVTVAVESIQQ